MKTLNSFSLYTEPMMQNKSKVKMIYFHQIDAIHISRFKSYTHLLQDKLKEQWVITDDIQKAGVIVSVNNEFDAKEDFYLTYFVANNSSHKGVKEPIATGFDMTADNLIIVLNQTSTNLRAPVNKKTEKKQPIKPRNIEVLKSQENSNTQTAKPTQNSASDPVKTPAASEQAFLNKPTKPEPVKSFNYYMFSNETTVAQKVADRLISDDKADLPLEIHQLSNGSNLPLSQNHAGLVLVVIELTSENPVADYNNIKSDLDEFGFLAQNTTVVLTGMNDDNESIFDQIYEQSEDRTQVTALDYTNSSEMKYFTQFLIK